MKNSEYQLKHLEMIQAVISRLAGNSFLIKGWEITIVLAGIGLYASNTNKPTYLYLILFSTIVLWILDAYYLQQEQKFRKLYEQNSSIKINNTNQTVSLSMNLSKSLDTNNLICTMISYPIVMLYFPVALLLVIYLSNINFLKGVIF